MVFQLSAKLEIINISARFVPRFQKNSQRKSFDVERHWKVVEFFNATFGVRLKRQRAGERG
jgi:hypothetical protein